MHSENDDRIKHYWKLSHRSYFFKMVDDKEIDEVENLITLPLHLGIFVLQKSKRNINNFIQAINGFYKNDLHFTGTDSLYF